MKEKTNNGYKVVTKKRTGNTYYKVIMLVILVAFVTFLITSICFYSYFTNGEIAKKYMITASSKDGDDVVKSLSQYRSIIDKYYLGDVDEESLKEGAIKGYIEGLDDPYSEYISKEDMEDYMEDTMGSFEGIGIYMVKDEKTEKIKILAPIKNSPAEKAGVMAGDLIISIDGVEYSGDEMSVAANKIKGEENSNVKLKVLRNDQYLEFDIKREKIIVNPVEGKVVEDKIGYISFSSFDDDTAEEFKARFEELKNQGIESLIIDLRNNGGGIVDEALEIAGYIADKGSVLLYEVDKNNNEKIEKSENDPFINMPIVILTNQNTASSSEILAGALKDLGKAKIVGNKTYGKGVIQSLLTLPDGSGLKITSQEYLTPNKTKINEVGIEPDEVVELPDDVDNVVRIEEDKDTQLQKAIEMLK